MATTHDSASRPLPDDGGDTDRTAREVRAALAARPKRLPTSMLYDARGSELFEAITRTPEYYLTRAELRILAMRAADIAGRTRAACLVELGAGSCRKTRLLLDALVADGGPLRCYVPVDISESALHEAAEALSEDYPQLEIRAVRADFTFPFDTGPRDGPVLQAMLGSTLGSLPPAERHRVLQLVRAQMQAEDTFLLGVDLVKDPTALTRAYDDAAGVTAAFVRNGLKVLNDRFGADFDPAAFKPVAVWDPEEERVSHALQAVRPQRVGVPGVGLTVSFTAGEHLWIGHSYKFRRQGLQALLEAAGFQMDQWWDDSENGYAMALAAPR
ncbi:L-histidine N(alpha)-methyltransferase [Streptomyces sp. NPDC047841]|uniref:L-histidine N(alpha)-methyltransferase n=1 Tax=Streptomyces sp. NPDC047841 TaxID=3154708 RepID=UPI003452827B